MARAGPLACPDPVVPEWGIADIQYRSGCLECRNSPILKTDACFKEALRPREPPRVPGASGHQPEDRGALGSPTVERATARLIGRELVFTVPPGGDPDHALITHMRACLGEGMCPFGHPLAPPDERSSAVFPVRELTGDCWQCEPPARWSVPPMARCYSWTRLTVPDQCP
jgi:hypothetical protein